MSPPWQRRGWEATWIFLGEPAPPPGMPAPSPCVAASLFNLQWPEGPPPGAEPPTLDRQGSEWPGMAMVPDGLTVTQIPGPLQAGGLSPLGKSPRAVFP